MTEIKQIANTYSKRVKNSIGIAHEFFTLLLASSRSPIFNSSLFTQILLHIRLYLLEFRRELVEGVLLHHHFHLAQTVLIACHLGACLLGMNRPITDFILPDIAQGIADRLHQRANHQVEKMMTLYI